MLFILLSFTVPLVIWLGLPPFLSFITRRQASRNVILFLACFSFFVSWYLPSPLIHGDNTEFTTHFIGGGIFCGLLWLYLKNTLKLRLHWTAEAATLFALVSTLGVTNELFELFVSETGLALINGNDTWWDLLANTLGALTFWLGYRFTRLFQK